MPSFTFVSTANAFALRGAMPVFVDIRPDTLNLDESAASRRDHAAHAGDRAGALRRRVACEMDAILGDRARARPGRDRGRRPGLGASYGAGRSARRRSSAA